LLLQQQPTAAWWLGMLLLSCWRLQGLQVMLRLLLLSCWLVELLLRLGCAAGT
jgi:hypothetical protein